LLAGAELEDEARYAGELGVIGLANPPTVVGDVEILSAEPDELVRPKGCARCCC
jgi:hypothetical protein